MNVETITSRQNPLMTHLAQAPLPPGLTAKERRISLRRDKALGRSAQVGAPVQTAVFSDGADIPALPDTVRAVCVSED